MARLDGIANFPYKEWPSSRHAERSSVWKSGGETSYPKDASSILAVPIESVICRFICFNYFLASTGIAVPVLITERSQVERPGKPPYNASSILSVPTLHIQVKKL